MKPPKVIFERSINYLYKGYEITVVLPPEIVEYLSQADIDFAEESDDLTLFEMVYPDWAEYVKAHLEGQLEIKRWQDGVFGSILKQKG